MSTTSIEWTEQVWNPTKGCDRVSPGCDHCYALTMAKRLKGMGQAAYQSDGDPATSGLGFLAHEWSPHLTLPLTWTKPQRIFVNSMSDLFHANISDEYIARVFAVMALAPQHTFQLLTKRHARMRSLLNDKAFEAAAAQATREHRRRGPSDWEARWTWPLPNVWLGVSAEDQQWADIRIPALLDTPAAVRWISAEPLLGPVDLTGIGGHDALTGFRADCDVQSERIGWVVVGGESGRGARPMQLDWARSLRDQCVAARVPYLFKQFGEWEPTTRLGRGELDDPRDTYGEAVDDGKHQDFTWRRIYHRVGKKAAGRELDGRTWDEYPTAVSA